MSHPTTRVIAALHTTGIEFTDAELLARFVTDRDTGAFELLVWRHAGLVLRICRGVLRDHHAAEDAAQAVFLALARQASSVRRTDSAAGWLFRVARRVSTRAARRRLLPIIPGVELDAIPAHNTNSVPDPDMERILHEELARLPESYRVLILLCFFEGLTHTEAARRLDVPVGTIAGRIARAKELLATRLTQRGLSLSLLTPTAIVVSPSFASATTRTAVAFAGRNCSGVSRPVLELAKGELHMTFARKMFVIGIIGAVVCGCLAFGLSSNATPPAPGPSQPVVVDKFVVQKPTAAVVGKSFAITPVTTDLQRHLLSDAGPNSTIVVLMNGTPVFKNPKTLDVEAFNLSELRTGLNKFPVVEGKSVAHIQIHYAAGADTSSDGIEVVSCTLENMARRVGFVPAKTNNTYHNDTFSFDEFIRPLKESKGADEREGGVGDERVRAYPVRTPLSRVLTQSAAGFVDVVKPLDCQADNWVSEDVDKSVKAAIGKLKLAKGQRVNFRLFIGKRDDRASERVRTACERWARDSGLELGMYTF